MLLQIDRHSRLKIHKSDLRFLILQCGFQRVFFLRGKIQQEIYWQDKALIRYFEL